MVRLRSYGFGMPVACSSILRSDQNSIITRYIAGLTLFIWLLTIVGLEYRSRVAVRTCFWRTCRAYLSYGR